MVYVLYGRSEDASPHGELQPVFDDDGAPWWIHPRWEPNRHGYQPGVFHGTAWRPPSASHRFGTPPRHASARVKEGRSATPRSRAVNRLYELHFEQLERRRIKQEEMLWQETQEAIDLAKKTTRRRLPDAAEASGNRMHGEAAKQEARQHWRRNLNACQDKLLARAKSAAWIDGVDADGGRASNLVSSSIYDRLYLDAFARKQKLNEERARISADENRAYEAEKWRRDDHGDNWEQQRGREKTSMYLDRLYNDSKVREINLQRRRDEKYQREKQMLRQVSVHPVARPEMKDLVDVSFERLYQDAWDRDERWLELREQRDEEIANTSRHVFQEKELRGLRERIGFESARAPAEATVRPGIRPRLPQAAVPEASAVLASAAAMVETPPRTPRSPRPRPSPLPREPSPRSQRRPEPEVTLKAFQNATVDAANRLAVARSAAAVERQKAAAEREKLTEAASPSRRPLPDPLPWPASVHSRSAPFSGEPSLQPPSLYFERNEPHNGFVDGNTAGSLQVSLGEGARTSTLSSRRMEVSQTSLDPCEANGADSPRWNDALDFSDDALVHVAGTDGKHDAIGKDAMPADGSEEEAY
eukprot:TRINITY_DN24978_c0_g1_i1.p1 TRINITY_DN24978_c0_g1~~TRINITY_DN24978_c0_g1_i1.p1  ORF type:complete len:610 (-),score=93.06 TRINITY_DN24978_c0_g1_i1:553-2316(-)